VLSRITASRPRGAAAGPSSGWRSGIISPLAQKREPSFRTCQRSFSARPAARAFAASRSGTPAARSSGVKMISAGRPTISASAQPSSRSAPAFHEVTRRSRSVVKIV
jgi:hypothetical protein